MTSDPTVTRFAPSPTGFSLVTTAMAVLYPCFCTRREIRDEIARAVVRRPRNQDRPIRGHALTFEAQQRIGKQCSGTDYALRLDLARALALTGPIEWVEEEEDGPHRKLADPLRSVMSCSPARTCRRAITSPLPPMTRSKGLRS